MGTGVDQSVSLPVRSCPIPFCTSGPLQQIGGDFPAAASVPGVTALEERGLIRGTSP